MIGMVVMYGLKGGLPWQGLPGKSKVDKYEHIKMKKAMTSIEDLTNGFPKEFCTFMNYSRKLKFEEKPDYAMLIGMFRDAFQKEGFEYD